MDTANNLFRAELAREALIREPGNDDTPPFCNEPGVDPTTSEPTASAAIYAWQSENPLVTIKEVDVPCDGEFIVAYKNRAAREMVPR